MSRTENQASFNYSDTDTSESQSKQNSPDKVKIPGKILIEGNIGSGKTTLLTSIEAPLYSKKFERVEKYSLLKPFYENPKKYAFLLQKQIAEINLEVEDEVDKPTVFERALESTIYIFTDMLHKDGILEDTEVEELKRYLNLTIPVAAFIYIDVDVDTCLERIKIRGRPGEENITREYLGRLKIQMDQMFSKYESSGIPCIRVKNVTDELEKASLEIDEFISEIVIK